MKIYPFLRACGALTIILVSLFSFASTVEAKAPAATIGTTLTIEPPIPVSVGNPAFIVLQLISSKGEPVADQPIEVFVRLVRQVHAPWCQPLDFNDPGGAIRRTISGWRRAG